MFRKTAQARSLGTFDVDGDGLIRVAQRQASDETTNSSALPAGAEKPRSYFLDGSRKLDVRALLSRVAETYAISDNPADYFFEAIRANTTNCPNENNDGFHQRELLRFDVKLGMPVYMTYAGKPHHVNHRTENPKTARGVLIDAHYNSDSPALASCPTCNTRTAERQNRDETGLHCRKCGTLVRDEFVEILVGLDAKKDPPFAEAVRRGQLKSGSMGCNCLSTSCNVCGHVAYSRPEFCDHIRAGNKGSLWLRRGNSWSKTSASDVAKELKRRKLAYTPNDFCSVTADDFEVRKAFEYCNNVIFDEYSRVDQPADPKAQQVEILKAAAVGNTAAVSDDLATVIRAETDALLRAAARKQHEREATMSRAAQMDQHGVGIQIEPGDDPIVIEPPAMPGQPDRHAPGQPGAPGAGPTDIDQYTENEMTPPGAPSPGGPNPEMDMGEFGVLPIPPGASAPRRGERRPMRKFQAAYSKWTVQVSEAGNARLLSADRSPVLIFRAEKAAQDPEERRAFGLEVLGHLLDNGLVATAKQYGAYFSPRFAQVVDHATDDMKEFADKAMYSSVLEGGAVQDDMDGDVRAEPPSSTQTESGPDADDMDGDLRGKPITDTQDGGAADHERDDQGLDTAIGKDPSDMRDKRPTKSVGKDDVLSGEEHDHAEPLAGKKKKGDTERPASRPVARPVAVTAAASKCAECGDEMKEGTKHSCAGKEAAKKIAAAERLEKLAAAKLVKAQLELAKAKEEAAVLAKTAEEAAVRSFARAMRIVAARQAADLEQSPLKLAAEAVLSESRVIGKDAATGQPIEYRGFDPELTRYLVAQLYDLGHADHLEQLMKRASDLMAKGDEYLIDAEGDVRNLRAAIPEITHARVAAIDEDALHAAEIRRQASSGNLSFTPAPSDASVSAGGHDKRSAIRGALGGSLVEAVRGRLGLN